MRSTLSKKGQVTIPKRLRDSLALSPGSILEFEEEQGKLVARRVVETDPFSALLGMVPALDVDATIAASRGPRWSNESDGKRLGNRGR